MTLAFDLDDTLIPCRLAFPLAAPRWPLPGAEPLREGAPALLRALRAEGHAVWVYTSSMRAPGWIRWTFLAHGVWLDGVINDARHRQRLGPRHPLRHYKLPEAFGIDLLFDDLVSRPDPRVVRVGAGDVLSAVVRGALARGG